MSVETALTPEDYRKRYFELKDQAERKNAERAVSDNRPNPVTIAPTDVMFEETIPPGSYWSGRVAKGRTLRIINPGAAAGVSALFWNADDTSERYNAGDTVKVQWTAQLSRGRLLLSDMGRVIASITDDTCGTHDFIAGGSSASSNLRKYGPGEGGTSGHPNSRDNLILAAGKHGLAPRDVGPCVTFFAPVSVDKDGKFVWQGEPSKPGAYIDLRAEMNLIVALSNCPHPLSPSPRWAASPVELLIWKTPSSKDDFCRSATEEAVRAFENTDAMTRV